MKQSGNSSIVFDIETMPLDVQTVRARTTSFEPPAHPGEFDENSVKTGHLKDPAKISAKIEEARKAHSSLVENYARNCATQEREYYEAAYERAPLSPVTGRVLAIGVGFADGSNHYLTLNEATDVNEAGLLEEFWRDFYYPTIKASFNLIGHNIFDFDVPFLIRRSWLLGIDIPENILRGRYLNDAFIDTMTRWNCGSRSAGYVKLDMIGQALGVGGKLEGVTGADFHRLYFGFTGERDKAMDYLEADVNVTRNVARRMGLI